jgi:cyclase
MVSKRIIPVLLLEDNYLVKTKQFKNPVYLGDPINAVKIYNEKEVDEIIIIDIKASSEKRGINFDLISEIASECFMPLAYGGGITAIEDIKKLFFIGVEKICINNKALYDFNLIAEAAAVFGNQSIVLGVDIKYNLFGKAIVYDHVKKSTLSKDPIEYINLARAAGAGEIFVNFVDKDGVMQGYDVPYLKKITDNTKLPIIASGGAGSLDDIKKVFDETNVSAAAAGSFFVFQGKHRAVLITYPDPKDIKKILE